MYSKADIDRLYLPKKEDERGLIQRDLAYKAAIIGLQKYLSKTNNWMMILEREHESQKMLLSINKDVGKYRAELKITEIGNANKADLIPTKVAKMYRLKEKVEGLRTLKDR